MEGVENRESKDRTCTLDYWRTLEGGVGVPLKRGPEAGSQGEALYSTPLYYRKNRSPAPPNVQSPGSKFCTEIRGGVQENGHLLFQSFW